MKMNSNIDGTKYATANYFVLSALEFFFIATSHKHCAFNITYLNSASFFVTDEQTTL